MIYLNFEHLSVAKQSQFFENSKKDVERKFGDTIRKYLRKIAPILKR